MPIDVDAYLARIAYQGARKPSARALASLQRQHLHKVPFENLDIHLGRPIVLEYEALFDKIVRCRRGGFCYELNGLFGELLRVLGYDVTLVSARTYNRDGNLGPEHDHLALMVRCEGDWLVDVGFGDAFIEPLDLSSAGFQIQGRRGYQIRRDGDARIYATRNEAGAECDEYMFTLRPRTLAEFDDTCRYHQESPQSSFTQKRVCTVLVAAYGDDHEISGGSESSLDGGSQRRESSGNDDNGSARITLRDRMLIVTHHGDRKEIPIADEHAWHAALREHFDIVLP